MADRRVLQELKVLPQEMPNVELLLNGDSTALLEPDSTAQAPHHKSRLACTRGPHKCL
jgi:hypothetical protein